MGQAIAGMALAAFLCSPGNAQSATDSRPAEAKPEFEVASIKPSVLPGRGAIRLGMRGGPGSADPGRVTYTLSTVRDLMADAYDVQRNQILGGPSWLDTERFDIVAKVPASATKQRVRGMLQSLLEERFKLALHRETRELPIYALVVSTKGPKLRDAPVTDPSAQPFSGGTGLAGMKLGRDGCPEARDRSAAGPVNSVVMTPHGECMISNGQTMDGLAMQLSNRFDRPVIDQTGLTGRYDLRLRYDPASMPGGRGGLGMTKSAGDGLESGPGSGDSANRGGPDTEAAPSIFNALQEQLGLKLEAKKGPVAVLVIDHLEKLTSRD